MNAPSSDASRLRRPVIWAVVGLLGVIALGLWRVSSWTGLSVVGGLVLLCGYVLFIALEIGSARREDESGATSRDRGTFELYALARVVTVVSALALATEPVVSSLRIPVGLALFVCGVALRTAARCALGDLYSHRVRIAENHRVIDSGPYAWVRHPAYAGMLLAHFGFVAVFFNVVSFGALLLLFVPAVVKRILVEEGELQELADYASFCRGKKRLMPWLW